MNNATVALNVARPVTPSATSTAVGKGNDDSQPSKRFDEAMDAARAAHATQADARHDSVAANRNAARANARADQASDDRAAARKSKDGTSDTTPTANAADDGKASGARATPAVAEDGKGTDDATKKDDTTGEGDGSLATTMLALIGVPPKVTELAGKALSTLTGATGKTGAAIGGVLGAVGLPAGGAASTAVAAADGAKEGVLASAGADTALAPTAVPATTASPFAALLATQGATLPGAKDDTRATDPTNSPMPLTHTPAMAAVDAPAVQVQATQATQAATSPQFTQELGEQIAWMGNGAVKEARIKLHPEELGSMDVRVNMDGGKVNIAIIAQHPAAVHAVQQTLSQLDTMLAHHGLSLGQADVGQRDPGQGAQGGSQGGQGGTGADDATAAVGTVATSRVSRSLVDEVA